MELKLDAKTTALISIDLQYGIVARDVAPHKAADVIERCAALATALRTGGGLVIWTRVLMAETLSFDADSPMVKPPVIPPQASELVQDVTVDAADLVVAKRQWGAFYGTDLEQHLLRRGIKTLVMAGISTNMGVESTARDASERGFRLVFAEDAMSGMKTKMHEFSVESIFPMIGKVRSTKEILKALG